MAPASVCNWEPRSTGSWKEREDAGTGRGQRWSKKDPIAQHELRTTNLKHLETFQDCCDSQARPVTPQNLLSVSTPLCSHPWYGFFLELCPSGSVPLFILPTQKDKCPPVLG